MPDLLWLIETNTSQNLNHVPEMKIHPRVQNSSQNPKTCPRIQNTSQSVKTLPRIQNTSQNPKLFWIDSGMCFGLWAVFLNSRKCFGFWDVFWILGSIFEFWEVFCPYEPPQIISHFLCEYVLVKQTTLPSLWFQRFHCLQCRGSSPH